MASSRHRFRRPLLRTVMLLPPPQQALEPAARIPIHLVLPVLRIRTRQTPFSRPSSPEVLFVVDCRNELQTLSFVSNVGSQRQFFNLDAICAPRRVPIE